MAHWMLYLACFKFWRGDISRLHISVQEEWALWIYADHCLISSPFFFPRWLRSTQQCPVYHMFPSKPWDTTMWANDSQREFNIWDATSCQFGTRNRATCLSAQSTALSKHLNTGIIQKVLIGLNGWILLSLIYVVSSVVCEIGPINPVSQDWGQVEVVVRGNKRGTSSIYFTYRVNSHIHAQKNILSLPLSRSWNSSMQSYLDPENKHNRFQLILFSFCKMGNFFHFPNLQLFHNAPRACHFCHFTNAASYVLVI